MIRFLHCPGCGQSQGEVATFPLARLYVNNTRCSVKRFVNEMNAKPKPPKLGRPPLAGERGVLLAGRVAPGVAEQVTAYAKKAGINRSEAVRQLIEAGLKKVKR